MFIDCKTEEEWKEQRLKYLTASDAGNYCGVNPFDDQGMLHLWEEKVGLRKRPDISGKRAVQLGKEAESRLRDIFLIINSEEWDLARYDQYGIWVSDEHPFMGATLDGLLVEKSTNDQWIWECKTTTVHDGDTLRSWRNGELPDNYWCQELHQMACYPKAVGVVTFALVMMEWNPDESFLVTIRTRRDDKDVKDDLPWLIAKAEEMNRMIAERQRPVVRISL